MKLRPHPTDNAPIHGYTIHYKPEFGDWETVQISSTAQKYTLENLWCGSRYQIYVTAYNGYNYTYNCKAIFAMRNFVHTWESFAELESAILQTS